MDARFIRRHIPRTFPRIVSVSVVNASLRPMASLPPPVFSAFDYRGTVGFTATIGAISVVAGYFGNTATATIFNALCRN